jgi:hypothetical protein
VYYFLAVRRAVLCDNLGSLCSASPWSENSVHLNIEICKSLNLLNLKSKQKRKSPKNENKQINYNSQILNNNIKKNSKQKKQKRPEKTRQVKTVSCALVLAAIILTRKADLNSSIVSTQAVPVRGVPLSALKNRPASGGLPRMIDRQSLYKN